MRDLDALLNSLVNIDRDSLVAILSSEAEAAERLANSIRTRTSTQRLKRQQAVELATRINRILLFFRHDETGPHMSDADLALCKSLERKLDHSRVILALVVTNSVNYSGALHFCCERGTKMMFTIEFFRIRKEDNARAMLDRITHIASDLESAKVKAKSLFETLNMPQNPDGLRILDQNGQEVFFWTPRTEGS
jgi:hypothetical protein